MAIYSILNLVRGAIQAFLRVCTVSRVAQSGRKMAGQRRVKRGAGTGMARGLLEMSEKPKGRLVIIGKERIGRAAGGYCAIGADNRFNAPNGISHPAQP